MTFHAEQAPSQQPLSATERRLDQDLLADESGQGIEVLDAYVDLQTLLMRRFELLAAQHDLAQEDADACDILLTATAKQFARTVQTKTTTQDRADYAIELLIPALVQIDELCQQHGQEAIPGLADDAHITESIQTLQQDIADKDSATEFTTLEQMYGQSCTLIMSRVL